MKTCSQCQKPEGEVRFNWKNRARGIKHSKCVDCTVIYNRERYRSSPEVRRKEVEKNLRNKQRNKEFVWNYLLAHPCVDCGFDDPRALDFDHLENKTRNVAEMRNSTWSIAAIETEIAKCEVRCKNCHAIKTAEQFDYYRGVAKLD